MDVTIDNRRRREWNGAACARCCRVELEWAPTDIPASLLKGNEIADEHAGDD
jgi:hypothetical protein